MKKYLDGFLRYRHLLKELVAKGIKLKYRRSYLGLIWTLLEPLLTSMVLAFVFGNLLDRGGKESVVQMPYAVYILTGRLLYSCFSSSTRIAMKSIRSNQGMIKKVYVPKYLYPLSGVMYNYILFLLSLIVLVFLMTFYTITRADYTAVVNLNILQCIIPLITLFLMCIGVGLILCTICVFFRDCEYLWDVVLLLIMYCSGIFYYIESVGEKVQMVMRLNPMYCIISNFRTTVTGNSIFADFTETRMMLTALIFSIVSVIVGTLLFKKYQDDFILHV